MTRAWRQAEERGPGTVGIQAKCALCKASVAALSANVPPALLVIAVQYRALTPFQALTTVRLIPDEGKRAEALVELAPYLPGEWIREALVVMHEIRREHARAEAMAGLAPHLPESLLRRELEAAYSFQDRETRTTALAGLFSSLARLGHPVEALKEALALEEEALARVLGNEAPFLPDSLVREVLTAVLDIADEEIRTCALADVIPCLPYALLQKVLMVVQATGSAKHRSQILARLIPRLAELGHTRMALNRLQDFALWEGFLWEKFRAQALIGLAPHLSTSSLRKAFTIAMDIKDEGPRAQALAGLAPYMPAAMLQQALTEGQSVAESENHACIVAGVLPRLAELGHFEQALDTVATIDEGETRARALANLASHLPPSLLGEALVVVRRAIRGEQARAQALIGLAPSLSEPFLEEALEIAQSIRSETHRAAALAGLIPHLPASERGRVLVEALATARTVGDAEGRARTSAVLCSCLARVGDPRRALALALSVEDEGVRSSALTALSSYLSGPLLGEALGAASALQRESARVAMLSGLVDQLPDQSLPEVTQIAATVKGVEGRATLLSALASRWPAQFLGEAVASVSALRRRQADAQEQLCLRLAKCGHPHEALVAVREIKDKAIRARVLARVAAYLPEELLEEARAISRTMWKIADRSQSLAGLAPRYAELGELHKGLEILKDIGRDGHQSEALVSLAHFLPKSPSKRLEFQKKLLSIASNINLERYRAEALVGLAPFLFDELLREALQTARAIVQEHYQAVALASLAANLRDEDRREEVLRETWSLAPAIDNVEYRVRVLVQVAHLLPQPDQSRCFQEALEEVRGIEEEGRRANVLVEAAARLPEFTLRQAFFLAQGIDNQENRVRALAALINQLADLGYVEEAFRMAQAIENREVRSSLFARLASLVARQSQAQLYDLWKETLPVLATRTRQDLLADIGALEPVMFALGGIGAVEETFRAIQDVGRWWP